ncbi:MAG: tRNA epoxyqueuosine(34) reductase QueG [Proteobacteria bacterium]|nr:tRNA epoxyqueuosine(34) reductase QueG [Pseudomonadota bacterium]
MKELIKKRAIEVGFALCGVTTAEPVDELAHLQGAIANGRVASMNYLARDPAARCDPRSLLAGARSVICCALAYGESGIGDRGSGTMDRESSFRSRVPGPGSRVLRARFARGAEYHAEVGRRLTLLWDAIRERAPGASAKACCDTSPILEKALAQRAGLGWIGRHTVLVNRELGSWFVLGEIVTDLELEPDSPHDDLCGDCTKCLDACPARAILSPRTLDAQKCISYLTIEAPRLEIGIGDQGSGTGRTLPCPGSRVPGPGYGCDLCQEACPYNNRGCAQ